MRNANRRLVLKSRPTGLAGPEHFTEETVPIQPPEPGQVLLESLLISVDPAMRVWISENPGYVPRVEIGDVMRAFGIARVLESRADGLVPGDLVQARPGWQTHATLPAAEIEKLDLSLGSAEDWIGPLGLTGVTAYFSLRDIARSRPTETVLVSGAAGAVGQMVGQIARIDACRVIGIAGGPEKCAYLTEKAGFHAAIDYKSEKDLAAAIARVCPSGIDVFHDNVGGAILDAAIANLRVGGRVVVCGRISQTAADELYGVRNLGTLIGKRGRLEGFVVFDYEPRYAEARAWIAAKISIGELRQTLHVIEGLERLPEGLGMLFRGENLGKLAVRISR